MLYLYGKNATDFTTNGEPIRNSYDEHVIRDEGFYLSFKLLLDKEEQYKIIKKEMIISALTPEGRNQFRVYDTWKRDTYVEIMAVQLMYDFDNKQVNSFKLKKANGKQVIQSFQNSFKSPLSTFTLDSSVTELHDFSTNDEDDNTLNHNALEILNRITKRWDSELMLNGFDIRMIKRLGKKTDALLYEKKNISEFEDESTMRGMATRIHATSTFRAEGSEEDTTISVTVDSPLLDEYAQVYEKSYVNNDCHTEAELIAWVKLKYSTENMDKPKRTIQVATNIIDGTEINYGDDLVLKYLIHDVDEIIRCVGYDYDPIGQIYYGVTLGDWKDSFLNTVTGNIVDTTNQQINQIKNNVTHIGMAANGRNRVAWGPHPVPNPIDGDLWYYFELDRPNEQELRIYFNGEWHPMDFATKKEVEQAQATADQAKQDAIKAHDDAILEADRLVKEQAVKFTADLNTQKTQLETEITASRDQAITTAQAGIDALETAHSGRMDGIKAEADAIKQTADKTKADIDLTISNAGFTTLNDTFANMRKLANDARLEALKKVDTTIYTAKMQAISSDLAKKADTLLVNQELANKVAQATYDKKVGELSTAVSGNATAIKKTETELTSKATKAEVDPLKTRLTTAESTISQTAAQVAIKANQSDLDTVSGRLTTAEAELTVQAGKIASKVSQTDFNKVDGRLVSAESTLTQQAGLIASKVSQTDFNKVAGRLTSAETAITQSGNEIALKASKTEAQGYAKTAVDDLEVGGRNYILKSNEEQSFNGFAIMLPLSDYVKSELLGVTTSVSVDVKNAEGDIPFVPHVYYRKENGENAGMVYEEIQKPTTKNWQRFKFILPPVNDLSNYDTLTLRKDSNSGSFIFKNLKLEKGNKVTDWSPAPEDVDEKIKTNETAITANANQIKLKASQTDLNTVSGKVDTAQAELVVQAGKIASKVEQSVFNAANTRLSTAESTITQHANLINSKVSQTEFSKVDGRLKTAETSITQEAGKITSLLTRVSGAETSINSIKSTANSNKSTISNHTGKISSIEQNISGIQTTVAGKANQSQVTQLTDSYNVTVGKVASWTNSYLVSASNHVKLTDINGNDLIKTMSYEIVLGIEVTGTQTGFIASLLTDGNGWKLEVINEKGYSSNHPYVYLDDQGYPMVATYHQNNYEVTATITKMASRESSSLSVLSDRINLRVSKGDVSSQINIEANRTLISSGKLILDANTYIMGTTFANDIKAKSLDAVYADIGNIRTKILTADVITSNHLKVDSALITKLKVSNLLANSLISDTIITDAMKANALTAITANITSIRSQILVSNVVEATHLKADTAMIDKLFATTALVDTLTSKVAFINSVKAIDISADRITAGTLNAANVNIINLNVSKIVGLDTDFIQSRWNNISTQITIDNRGINITGSDQWRRTYFRDIGFDFFNSSGAYNKAGAIGYFKNHIDVSGSNENVMSTGLNRPHVLGIGANQYHDVALGYNPNISQDRIFQPALRVRGDTGDIHLYTRLTDGGTSGNFLSFSGAPVKNVPGMTIRNDNRKLTRIHFGDWLLHLEASSTIDFWSESKNTMTLRDVIHARTNIQMNGNNVVGNSDRRLKKHIHNTSVRALNLIRKYVFVDFEWIDKNRPEGTQFGLIAQDTPFISEKDSDGVWNINQSKQVMLNTLGLKELDEKQSMQNVKITKIDTYVTQHELEIKNLKKRIKKLEDKVA